VGLAVQHAAPVLAAAPQASRGGGAGGQVPAAARGRKAAGGRSASAAIAPKQTSAATKIVQATQPEKRTDQQQLNTHLPRGSVPSGARPPGPAGLKDSHLGKRKDGLAGERQTEAVSATRRKITIPSMDLDDDDGDSAPSSQETVEKKPEDTHKKLGALVLEVAGVKFYKDNASTSLIGNTILLVREPENRYDKNAMKIVRGQEQSQIGHVGRNIAAFLAPLVDNAQISFEMGVITNIKRDAGSICRLIEVSISISQPQNAPPPPAELKTVLEGKKNELAKALAKQQTPSMSGNGKGGVGGGVYRTNVVAPGRLSSPQQQQINSQPQQTAASRAPTPQQRHHNHQKEQPLQQPLQQQQPPQEKLSAQQKQVQAQQAQMEARHQAQAQHLRFQAQKAAMDKIVNIKSPLIPLVNLKQLLQKVDLFPAPIRWELLIHRGVTRKTEDAKSANTWGLKALPMLPSEANDKWHPKDDMTVTSLEMKDLMIDLVVDAEEVCIMELFEMKTRDIEEHLTELRASIAVDVSYAKKLSAMKTQFRQATLAAEKERIEKVHMLERVGGQDWWPSLNILYLFEDDVPSMQGG